MTLVEDILPSVPGHVLSGLRRADSLWQQLRNDSVSIPQGVQESNTNTATPDYDVVIAGGTLGILLAVALQKRGWRVAVIERGKLQGREQEWNISRQELQVFLELDLLSEAELETAIATEYNPGRVRFFGGKDIWVKDILNIGVNPVYLLEILKNKFLQAGGKLFEYTPFDSAVVYANGVEVKAGEESLKTRLLLDAMGHFSAIAQQARKGEKPSGVCLVVGSCAQGYPVNDTGDLLVSFTPIMNQCQYFWEAFPARDGRTTYLFTYLDAHPQRFSLEFFLEEYFRLLPEYQQVERKDLNFQRILFGFFPSYAKSPLNLPWSRILPIGDSSGSQSPVSFGGFGAMVRHLQRLSGGIQEALQADALSRSDLALLQPYQPNVAVTGLFQKAMSVGIDQNPSPNQINDLLAGVFAEMEKLGDEVLHPFLQDVVQFSTLSQTLPRVHPSLVLPIVPQLGILTLAQWLRHYLSLGLYSGLYPLGQSFAPGIKHLPAIGQYYYHRWLDAWKYGSGGDYHS